MDYKELKRYAVEWVKSKSSKRAREMYVFGIDVEGVRKTWRETKNLEESLSGLAHLLKDKLGAAHPLSREIWELMRDQRMAAIKWWMYDQGIVAYVVVSEAWMTVVDVPEGSKEDAKSLFEQTEGGVPIRLRPSRMDVVSIIANNIEDESWQKVYMVEMKGSRRFLKEFIVDESSPLGGNLFELLHFPVPGEDN